MVAPLCLCKIAKALIEKTRVACKLGRACQCGSTVGFRDKGMHCVRQKLRGCYSAAPHAEQNFAPCGLVCWQRGQAMSVPGCIAAAA